MPVTELYAFNLICENLLAALYGVALKVDISPRIKNEFEIQPVRWVVKRTFGWMTWSRRLSKDYEIRSFYQENICIISNLQTLLRRF